MVVTVCIRLTQLRPNTFIERGGGHEVQTLAEEHLVIAPWGELVFFKYVAFGSLTKLQGMIT